MTLDDIKKAIDKADTIAILTHESPDGDAMGSSLAMSLALKKLGKNPDVIIPEYSKTYEFLPDAKNIKNKSNIENYDLAIALDCGDIKRLNGFINYFEDAKTTISIDHHSMNPMFGDINYVDHTSPACCQILVIIFKYLGIEIDKQIGTCLLAGIITDTGGFKYPGVTAETFEFVADLLRSGINVSKIYKKVLQIKPKANFELSKIAMNRMEFLEEGKISFTYITCKDEKQVGAEEGAHEGIVEIGRDIEGVEVAIFLHQAEDRTIQSITKSKRLCKRSRCMSNVWRRRPRKSRRLQNRRNTTTNKRKINKRNKKIIVGVGLNQPAHKCTNKLIFKQHVGVDCIDPSITKRRKVK